MKIVRRLRQHGHTAYWAGGCVRDQLLGKAHQDIDIATDATPDRIVELFRVTRKVGMQFGVVLVRQYQFWIEVATFRTDLEYQDGRRPEGVVFATAEEDAQRRDFTINGLFYDPISDDVIDYVEGQRDIERSLIRAIGKPEERFAEDHLRMLRAVRFAARLAFEIEPTTADAITRHASQIARISPERIREELDKMLSHPNRSLAFELTADLGLLDHLWQGADRLRSDLSPILQTLQNLDRDADFVTALACMLAEQSPSHVRKVGSMLRCSNEQVADLAWLTEHVDHLHQVESLSLATFKKLAAHRRFEHLLDLHRARCLASGSNTTTYDIARQRFESIPSEQVQPAPFVTGQDLIDRGLQPGPVFKKILEGLYDDQLNETLTNRQEALDRLDQMIAAESES
jgi:poly(A) polymerase